MSADFHIYAVQVFPALSLDSGMNLMGNLLSRNSENLRLFHLIWRVSDGNLIEYLPCENTRIVPWYWLLHVFIEPEVLPFI